MFTQAVYQSQFNPHSFWFRYNLGLIYFKGGRYQEAAESLEKAMAAKWEQNQGLIYLSKIYQPMIGKIGDIDNRIRSNLKIGYGNCTMLLVLSHYYLKDFPEALRYAASALGPDIAHQDFLYYYAGLAAYNLKRYDQSVYFLKECIKKNPQHADAFYYLGLCLKALGKEEMALVSLQQAAVLHQTVGPLLPIAEGMNPQIF